MRTSVIIPSFDAASTLPLVLEALMPQIHGRGDREVLVVESGGRGAAATVERSWPWARVVTFDERLLPGRARNVAGGGWAARVS